MGPRFLLPDLDRAGTPHRRVTGKDGTGLGQAGDACTVAALLGVLDRRDPDFAMITM